MDRRSFLKLAVGTVVCQVLPVTVKAQQSLNDIIEDAFRITWPSMKLSVFEEVSFYSYLRKSGLVVFGEEPYGKGTG